MAVLSYYVQNENVRIWLYRLSVKTALFVTKINWKNVSNGIWTFIRRRTNCFDDIVRESVAELICKTVFPIKLNIVVADCEDITQEILEEYCDSICIYPSYSADKNISREYSYETMIRNSDCVIFYADSPFNNEIGAYNKRQSGYKYVFHSRKFNRLRLVI